MRRRAALAGGIERRDQHVVDDLLFQRRRVDEKAIQPARLRDQRHDRAVFGRERTVDEPRHFRRARERNAANAKIGDKLAADFSVALHQLQHVARQAGRVEQLHRSFRDVRRLLGRLGDHRVARRERRGDLAGENRQREIPGLMHTNTPRPCSSR